MNEQIWVELVDGVLVAKVRGPVSAALLERCQQEVRELAGSSLGVPVLYDALELQGPEAAFEPAHTAPPPPGAHGARGAIVLADGRLRNPLRMAFGDDYDECRIFDNDLDAAYSWVCAALSMAAMSSSA